MKEVTIPIVVCIDVEPDAKSDDGPAPGAWRGYEEAVRLFGNLRGRLGDATESAVHFSWFVRMDPQIGRSYGTGAWAADRYADHVSDATEKGDDIGLHTHLYRTAGQGGLIIDNGSAGWLRECVEFSFSSYRAAFNRAPASHRFGDRILSTEAVALLAKTGCAHDLTLEPGFREDPLGETGRRLTGPAPDMRDFPAGPYRPSASDYRAPSGTATAGLWFVPVTTGMARVNPLNPFAGKTFFTLHLGLASRLFRPIVRAALAQAEVVHIATVTKTDMVLDARLAANMRRNMEFLASGLGRHTTFVTPSEALSVMGLVQ